jgi:regulatory protein
VKNKRRVNVYLDGTFALGLVDTIAAGLRVGQVLSDEESDDLRRRDAAEQAYEQALRFLGYRPRSTDEVRRYLAGKQVPEDLVAQSVDRLAGAGLLDDHAFARFWVENRESFRPRGTLALRYELRRKGVSDEAIEAAIQEVDEADGAYQAARAQARRLAHVDRGTFHRRLAGYLGRRGYSYEIVRETVERLWLERAGHDGTDQASERSRT